MRGVTFDYQAWQVSIFLCNDRKIAVVRVLGVVIPSALVLSQLVHNLGGTENRMHESITETRKCEPTRAGTTHEHRIEETICNVTAVGGTHPRPENEERR